jgi:hypothetical protein
MKAIYPLLCIAAVAACDDNPHPLNGSITSALKPGMTEQQVAEVSNNRVPDRVVMTTCGTETPKPFACKVYVYDGALRGGQYDRKLWVVLEDAEDNGKSANGSDSRVEVTHVCANCLAGHEPLQIP